MCPALRLLGRAAIVLTRQMDRIHCFSFTLLTVTVLCFGWVIYTGFYSIVTTGHIDHKKGWNKYIARTLSNVYGEIEYMEVISWLINGYAHIYYCF